MSSVGLALNRTASVSQEFAQEPPPNPMPTSPYRDSLIGGPTPNFLPPNIPEDTVTISNTLSRSSPLHRINPQTGFPAVFSAA